MNADSFEKEPASARSDTELTVTNEAQPPKAQVTLLLALIGVHRRPSAVPEGLGWSRGRREKRFSESGTGGASAVFPYILRWAAIPMHRGAIVVEVNPSPSLPDDLTTVCWPHKAGDVLPRLLEHA